MEEDAREPDRWELIAIRLAETQLDSARRGLGYRARNVQEWTDRMEYWKAEVPS